MVRRRVWIPALIVVVVALLVLGNLLRGSSGAQEVRIEEAGWRALEAWVRAPGWIQPVVAVDISSNVTGRVARLHVHEGDAVRAGELLLELDDTKFRSSVEQYAAMLRAAAAQLALAEAQRDLAAQVATRREDLFARGLLSAEELESARVDLRVREAQVEAQREEIDRLRAALAEAQRDLEETRFHAPMDGIVAALNLEEGENVLIGTMNAPGTVILTLADLSRMEVEARVNESDVVRVRAEQTVRVIVDAQPDSVLDGRVTSVGESGERQSREDAAEFEVRVSIRRPPLWIKPGMSADVEILTARADSALSVPIQALVARDSETVEGWEHGEEKTAAADSTDRAVQSRLEPQRAAEEELVEGLFVVEADRAVFRRVRTGIRSEQHVEVLAGVSLGERVITGPYRVLRRLEQGAAIRVDKSRAEDQPS